APNSEKERLYSSMYQIDVNCDMGESFGRFWVGNDKALMPFITSANIACGFHGGDPLHIEKTIRLAKTHGVRIGAHPSYPDLQGFGRRKMQVPEYELRAIVKYQIAALKGLCESEGIALKYVKPHGALYHASMTNFKTTMALLGAIEEIDPKLEVMGLSGSLVESQAKEFGIGFIAEGFADRRYESSGKLQSRKVPGALITDPVEAVEQVLQMVLAKQVPSVEGEQIDISVDSICIHGDNPAALKIMEHLSDAMGRNQILKMVH
ncbi:MAG: 5-oxoprolinase subunit PxpA, partial [Bacteroidota bacterium]